MTPAGAGAGGGAAEQLALRFGLPAGSGARLDRFRHLLATDPLAPTAIREPSRILDDHLADSLVALELDALRAAGRVVDIGPGAGLPGLPLAIALPRVQFVLVESSTRKCAFIVRAAAACQLENVEVVASRIEDWQERMGQFDVALVRAVARLEVVIEYGAPLLRLGGQLVVWRGQRDPEAERRGDAAGDLLGLRADAVRPVRPYEAAEARHLHLFSKVMDTPARFPRRAGMAVKHPLGGS